MTDQCVFVVSMHSFKAIDLRTRHRFREQLKLKIDFDDVHVKTERALVGGGDVNWKFKWQGEYIIYSDIFLEERMLKIRLTCQHDKSKPLGHLAIDLFTLATGPAEHNLPLVDYENKTIGRLSFIIEMNQKTDITAEFKKVEVKGLSHSDPKKPVNAYLKYAYSKVWTKIQDPTVSGYKAVYSNVVQNNPNPVFTELPPLQFKATLKEMLHESIVLHVTNHGKVHNTTLGRCNLLFRTVVDNGKTFKDGSFVTFKGSIKTAVSNATIEGSLTFKNLPKYAQMKAVSVVKRPIHTENGIMDAVPLIPGLPVPKVKLVQTETKSVDDAHTTSVKGISKSPSEGKEKPSKSEQEKKNEPQMGNLISFSPVPRPRAQTLASPPKSRQRSSSISSSQQQQQQQFRQAPAPPVLEDPFFMGELSRQGSNLSLNSPVVSRAKKNVTNPFAIPENETPNTNPFSTAQEKKNANPFAF